MLRLSTEDREGRSVVPLSLGLLVFNVLGGASATRAIEVDEVRARLDPPADDSDEAESEASQAF